MGIVPAWTTADVAYHLAQTQWSAVVRQGAAPSSCPTSASAAVRGRQTCACSAAQRLPGAPPFRQPRSGAQRLSRVSAARCAGAPLLQPRRAVAPAAAAAAAAGRPAAADPCSRCGTSGRAVWHGQSPRGACARDPSLARCLFAPRACQCAKGATAAGGKCSPPVVACSGGRDPLAAAGPPEAAQLGTARPA